MRILHSGGVTLVPDPRTGPLSQRLKLSRLGRVVKLSPLREGILPVTHSAVVEMPATLNAQRA
jgi:hypothetical protein